MLRANELVPGRRVLIASEKLLSDCLCRAKLLQKAQDEGSLKTLISLFASQPAVVLEGPPDSNGMCKIRTNVGTIASLPVGAIGVDPDAERRLKIKFEASVAHDMAAMTLQEGWRTSVARAHAKKIILERRKELDYAAAQERSQCMSEQKNLVEGLAVIVIQALVRGFNERRHLKQLQCNTARDMGYNEQDFRCSEAATMLASQYRGIRARRRWGKEREAAHDQLHQSSLEKTVLLEENFLRSCSSGDLHGVHVLVRDHGINVNVADSRGNSGFLLACAGGFLDVARFLASVVGSKLLGVPNYSGWTPLHRACFNGHLDMVKFLVKFPSSSASQAQRSSAQRVGAFGDLVSQMLSSVNHFGSTPLHVSIPNGHLRVAEYLLDMGAPLEARNASGDTPLNFAVVCRQKDMVALLLDKGGNRNSVNDEGRTPATSALATGQPDVATLISTWRSKSLGASLERTAKRSAPSFKHAKKAPLHSTSNQTRSAVIGSVDTENLATRAVSGLLEGCTALPARTSLVENAWKQIAEDVNVVALRPSEAATVLRVLGLILAPSPPTSPAQHPALSQGVKIRLDGNIHTAEDLKVVQNLVGTPGSDFSWPAVQVTPKHAQTARKKLLSLIRCPKGAATFIAERKQSVAEWSDSTGRAFLARGLGLPGDCVRSFPAADGLSLLSLDGEAIQSLAATTSLPSILKHRLAFHCELLRAVAVAEDNNGVVSQRAEARSPSTRTSYPSTEARTPAATSAPPVPQSDAPSFENEYFAALDGGCLSSGHVEDGMRVQVAHFSDLTLAMSGGGGRPLPAELLPLARRSAASRGTVVSSALDENGSVSVLLDDGFTAALPPAALYLLPSVLLHPAQLRVGASARVVQPSWLRQLLLNFNETVDCDSSMESVNSVSERLGGSMVTVVSVDKVANRQRVKVSTEDGFESGWLPADSLAPPPNNAAVRLLRKQKRSSFDSNFQTTTLWEVPTEAINPASSLRPEVKKPRPVSASSARHLYRTVPLSTAKHPPAPKEGSEYPPAHADPFGTQVPFVPPEMLNDARIRDAIGRQEEAVLSSQREQQKQRGNGKANQRRPFSAGSIPRTELPRKDNWPNPTFRKGSKDSRSRPPSSGLTGKRSTWLPVAVQTFEFTDGLEAVLAPQQETSKRVASDRWESGMNQRGETMGKQDFRPGGDDESSTEEKSLKEGGFEDSFHSAGASVLHQVGGIGKGEFDGNDLAGVDSEASSLASKHPHLRELVRERVENLVDDEMNFSTGGWTEMGQRSFDKKLRAMEEQMARREEELSQRAEDRAAKTKAKMARDSARMKTSRSEDPDATLRKQVEKMSEQMLRKEREIKDNLERQRKIAEAAAARESTHARKTQSREGKTKEGRGKRRENSHHKKRQDIFRSDIGAEVDSKLRQSWREAEKEVGELSAGLNATLAELGKLKECETDLRVKIQSLRRRHDRNFEKLGRVHSLMGQVKLVKSSDSERKITALEDELQEVAANHVKQVNDLQSNEARLMLLQRHLEESERKYPQMSSEDLDSDAQLVHGIERKRQLIQNRVNSLRKLSQELSNAMARQNQQHADFNSQLSVASMTLTAMKAALCELGVSE